MKQVLAITRKELRGYFGSPMAIIFVGGYLLATLFSFFWVDTFFSRGIADVRPLFRWTPVLMIFLVAALTMRQWSEEQRSGTLEILRTLPVSTFQLVVGKFLAVVSLVAVSLALTFFLPLTVELLGNLDWGPVVGGYLAAILLASAYAAIGLFVSSRTDNQIVALLSTMLLCGVFYVVGTAFTEFVGNVTAEILRAIGVGSRFESIQRGVIDLRDLVYYLSLTGIFLSLNVLSLRAQSWSQGERTLPQRRSVALTSALLIVNLLVVNVWMYPLRGLRVDLTQYNAYTLSRTTRDLLDNLQEPLLLRGYFSEKTHPLLAPLVPRVRDMLREYEVAGGERVTLEIVDPAQEPEKEAEANQVYGIRPTPFQVSGRYETSVINSYFNILVQYGDQSVVLGFDDLIEVQRQRDGNIDVQLRNLEYDLTSSIKKAVYGFQSVDAVLAALDAPVRMTLYVTPETLPQWLSEVPETIQTVAQDIADRSGGKFTYDIANPNQPDSPMSAQELYDTYNIQPFATSLFSQDAYYLHMVLESGEEGNVIYPTGEMTEADVRKALESALKRSASGFLQVVGVWTPPATPETDMFGQAQQPLSSWNQVQASLREEYEVRPVDLSTGQIPTDVDVLLVVAPQQLDDKARYAIDQYLMRGGAVIVAAGNYMITPDQMTGGLGLKPVQGGLQAMLTHYGVTVEQKLVLDPQNEPFPVPVVRQVGDFQVQEIQTLDYPFFVDVRADGMAKNHPVVANLQAVTLNWSSPLVIDEAKNAERSVEVLLSSSPDAWTQSTPNIQPDFETYPEHGFPVGETRASYPLAVAIQGSFESFFAGKPSPFEGPSEEGVEGPPTVPGTIETSPETARLLVVGSAEFVDDIVFEISGMLSQERYQNSLRLVKNAVAWAVEDLDLLNIRAQGTSVRLLVPLDEQAQSFWEILNYIVALVALVALAGVSRLQRRTKEPLPLIPPQRATAPTPVDQPAAPEPQAAPKPQAAPELPPAPDVPQSEEEEVSQ